MSTPALPCQTPVLFLVFRRPELTRQVLARLREARPARLFIAADGPSATRPEEAALCAEVRKIITEGVDWPCEVSTRFQDENLGCKRAVSSAIHWAFRQTERLIVVEDDCLPDLSFFTYCDELLERYADDARVMEICGANLSGVPSPGGASYHATRFGTIWGWATWRRAWAAYDVEMKYWAGLRGTRAWRRRLTHPGEAAWRTAIYDSVARGGVDTWDIQWEFTKDAHQGLSLVPTCNLVTNLGWGAGATHTHSAQDPRAAMPAGTLSFPLSHPQELKPHEEAERAYLSRYCQERPLAARALNKLWRLFRSWTR